MQMNENVKCDGCLLHGYEIIKIKASAPVKVIVVSSRMSASRKLIFFLDEQLAPCCVT